MRLEYTEEVTFDVQHLRRDDGDMTVLITTQSRQPSVKRRPILLIPGFCQTTADVGSISRMLNRLGHPVTRLDASYYVSSRGTSMYKATLSNLVSNISAGLEYMVRSGVAFYLVTLSVASRCAYRAIGESCPPQLLSHVGVLPVVSFQKSLASLIGDDPVARKASGGLGELAFDLWGFNVAEACVEDAVDKNFHTIGSTVQELNSSDLRTILVGAEKDDVVEPKDLKYVVDRCPSAEMRVVPDLSHRSFNPPGVRRFVGEILAAIGEPSSDSKLESNGCSIQEIRQMFSIERRWAKSGYKRDYFE